MNRVKIQLVASLGVMAMVSGCASVQPNAPPENVALLTGVPANQVEAPPVTDYRIGVGDKLRVTVFREPDLSVDGLLVDPAGVVSLPGVGEIQVVGSTASQLANEIAERLNRTLLRNAQVSVAMVSTASRVVTVDGEVGRPGMYPMPGRLTLMQAIALAEGAKESAKQSDVVVFRRVNGERTAARFDLRYIRAARAPDPEILPGDVVVMGFSRAHQIYRDILQVLPAAAGIFVAIEQN
jgi:polysaccharide export outer membrane protein